MKKSSSSSGENLSVSTDSVNNDSVKKTQSGKMTFKERIESGVKGGGDAVKRAPSGSVNCEFPLIETIPRQREKKIPEKKSVGIVCRKYNDKGELMILLVCRRCTYAFDMFMQGSYNSNNNGEILVLLDGMTADEKIILLSLNFEIVWYYWWLNGQVRSKLYFELKSKYEKIINDDGARLQRLIERSKNGTKVWEIPKGRRKYGEEMIHGAIREFEEETGMKKQDYRFVRKAIQHTSFTDCGVKYTASYFVADSVSTKNIKVQYSRESIGEICEVRWMTLNEIKTIDQYNRIEKIFNNIK